MAWFALVREEESDRKRHVDTRIAALERRVEDVAGDAERRAADVHAAISASVEELRALLERGVGARADATLSELWRRMEAADARQATAIQRLAEEVERLREEQDATNELLERLEIVPAPVSTEVRESRLRGTAGLFRGHEPVIDLMSDRGRFLRAANAEGIDAYGIHPDPSVAEAGRALGLDIRIDDPVGHLRALDPESVGGVLYADGLGGLSEDGAAELFEEVARALRPGGILVVTPEDGPQRDDDPTLAMFARTVLRAGFQIDRACAVSDDDAARPGLVARKPA